MRTLRVEPTSELNELLDAVDSAPVTLLRSGVRYRLAREDEALFVNYDPVRERAALQAAAGSLKGFNVKEFLEQIREERDQDSIGRPRL